MLNANPYKITDNSIEADDLLKDESIFSLANGYIGVRANFEEGYPKDYKTVRGAYINGFYDFCPIEYEERFTGFPDSRQKMVNLPDIQSIELWLGNERFNLFSGEILSFTRVLDMEGGFSLREIHWRSPKGKEVEICVKRMAHFTCLPLFTIDYTVRSVNFDGEIRFVSRQNADVKNYSEQGDPRVASKSERALQVVELKAHEDIASLSMRTSNSGLNLCVLTRHKAERFAQKTILGSSNITTELTTDIKDSESLRVVKYCVFADSIRHDEPAAFAGQTLAAAFSCPAEELYQKQQAYLANFYQYARVSIDDDPPLQESVNFSLFQLLQSVGKDKYSNICAKGLSGEGYEGHYFWDTEIYIFPFFLLTNPAIAKNLLMYRYNILDGARRQARLLGHKKGALYPWRTITGDECSSYYPSGSSQYHINGDIVYAYIQYYLATGDEEFMYQYGAEILFETARLWMDVGHFHGVGIDGEQQALLKNDGHFLNVETDGKQQALSFRIDCVTGPDEYTCIVNNNYYTNAIAAFNLKWAARFYDKMKSLGGLDELNRKINLTDEEPELWRKAAGCMYLPYNEKLDIHMQDDSFLHKKEWDFENTPADHYPLLLHYHPLYIYRHQVCKQADTVLSHFLLEEGVALTTIRNSFAYYERITTHDSSLSHCIFSIVAAKIGDTEKAYDYFMRAARLDLDNEHKNAKDGIHTANMGGSFMGIVYGFGGLRILEKGLCLNPVLPEKWNAYSFTIQYRSACLKVEINRSGTKVTLQSGKSVCFFIKNTQYKLEQPGDCIRNC